MTRQDGREHVDTLVIGGGQTGLAVGHHLQRHGLQFLIVDANERVGDSWRNLWDSLRLFTPVASMGSPASPFRRLAIPSPPRTRWPTISRHTPGILISRSDRGSEWTGSLKTVGDSW